MKKLALVLLLGLSFTSIASNKCYKGEVVFYGELEGNVGYQRLCYDKKDNQWFFGVKTKEDKNFEDTEVKLEKQFSYKEGNEDVKGYSLSLDEEEIILMVNNINDHIQQSLSIINGEPIPFVNDSVIFNKVYQ